MVLPSNNSTALVGLLFPFFSSRRLRSAPRSPSTPGASACPSTTCVRRTLTSAVPTAAPTGLCPCCGSSTTRRATWTRCVDALCVCVGCAFPRVHMCVRDSFGVYRGICNSMTGLLDFVWLTALVSTPSLPARPGCGVGMFHRDGWVRTGGLGLVLVLVLVMLIYVPVSCVIEEP